MISLEQNVPVAYLDVPVSRYDVDLAPLEQGWRLFADNDDGQIAAALQDRTELAGTLRVEMLGQHYGRRKVFIQRADQRRKGADTAGRGAHYYEVMGFVARIVISHDLSVGVELYGNTLRDSQFVLLFVCRLAYITFFAGQQHLPNHVAVSFRFLRASLKYRS